MMSTSIRQAGNFVITTALVSAHTIVSPSRIRRSGAPMIWDTSLQCSRPLSHGRLMLLFLGSTSGTSANLRTIKVIEMEFILPWN